jgi:hypothetical protein
VPLIRSASTITTGWFSRPSARVVLETYEPVLASLVAPAIAMLVFIGIAMTLPSRRSVPDAEPPIDAAPPHEWIAMTVLLVLPVFGAILAGTVLGNFVSRYALSWVWGFSALTAFSAAALVRQARSLAAAATVALLAWTGAKEAASARLLALDPPTLAGTFDAVLAERSGTLPIAITHGHTFMVLAEYAPPEIASRLVMLTQPARITAKWGESGDRALIGLARWRPLRVQDFDAFVTTHRRFLLYGPPMWLAPELRAAGARLILKGEDPNGLPFAVSTPECVTLYEVEFD